MFRYVGLIWDDTDERHTEAVRSVAQLLLAASSQWQEVLTLSGMRVFCADSRPHSFKAHVLPNRLGVVLGVLFERNADPEDDSASRQAVLDEPRSIGIVRSGGRRLLTEYWGNYVAFLFDPSTRTKWVVKDPCGSLPCFSSGFCGVALLFSCIADCLALKLLRFSIDANYLQALVTASGWLIRRNALEQVVRIHGGECLRFHDTGDSRTPFTEHYWKPDAFLNPELALDDPDRAARALRATVHSCVRAWAGCYEVLLHRLSGGLDSSIVLGCLKSAQTTRIVSYTYFHQGSRADERPWARIAAQHAGCGHLEHALDIASLPLASARDMLPTVEPVPALGYVQKTALEHGLAVEYKAGAVFSGDGGDSGFGSEAIGQVVADYLRLHGLHVRVFHLALQVAQCTGQSAWTVLAGSLRAWWTGSAVKQRPGLLLGISKLVSPELRHVRIPSRSAHPWFHSHADIPWNLVLRLGTLPWMNDFYIGSHEEAPAPLTIAPLYSQPVVELCLRIPLFVHFEGGRDRGLARRAFAADVPAAILNRLWKDRAPGFHAQLIQRQLGFLREMLLDGVLVRARLLDRAAVEDALSIRPSKCEVLPAEILRHLDTELWVRQWT